MNQGFPGPQLSWGVFIALFTPILFQEGMFLDGVSYAAIARNLAIEVGDFCHLHYTNTLYPILREHPPLAIWCQSWFFRWFGDHLWVERVYAILMAGLSAWGISLNWRLLAPASWRKLYWLPVLCWLGIPIVVWSYRNNMLENTMSVMVLAATYCLAKAVQEKGAGWTLLGSFWVLAAVLSKGPVGLFPLAVPFILGVFSSKRSMLQGMGWSVGAVLGFCLLGFGLWWLMPCIQEVIQGYVQTQLFPAMATGREVPVVNRLNLILVLVQQLLPVLLAAILIIGWFRWKSGALVKTNNPCAGIWLGIAVSGSLPIMLSLKQSAHYLVPSMPYYAMFFAGLLAPVVSGYSPFTARIWRIGKVLVPALLVLVAVVTALTDRDRSLLADVRKVVVVAGQGSTIATTDALSGNWLVVAYFSRIGNVSLHGSGKEEYYLCGPQDPIPGVEYQEIPSRLEGFRLYRISAANTPHHDGF
ncbi:MAG: glycosyltransferase family 39 protein [Chitinophagales bacterium]|nr:glycosyltransferase family 39 protein [Chitinophagales bacterium]